MKTLYPCIYSRLLFPQNLPFTSIETSSIPTPLSQPTNNSSSVTPNLVTIGKALFISFLIALCPYKCLYLFRMSNMVCYTPVNTLNTLNR